MAALASARADSPVSDVHFHYACHSAGMAAGVIGMNVEALTMNVISMLLAPGALGVINKTKAWFGGRKGAPLLQPYYDLSKLLQKGNVYSKTSTWIFKAEPVIILAATLIGISIVPIAGSSLLSFPGDFFFLAGLLALIRFTMVVAALDTGSSFEGMGASREILISVLAEPALFLLFAALLVANSAGSSITEILNPDFVSVWAGGNGPALALVCAGLFLLLLAENARIPVDDPDTHLELTMVHEVMILDSSGCDLAYLSYAYALKLWIFGSLIVGIILPFHSGNIVFAFAAYAAGMAAIFLLVGVVESTRARLKLLYLPSMLVFASIIGVLSVTLTLVVK